MSYLIIDNKEISSIGSPISGAEFIFTIAYAYHVSKQNLMTDDFELNADLDTHEELLTQIEGIEIFLNDSLSGVGEALAVQDHLSNESVKKLGYLISGLSDLQALVGSTKDRVDSSMKAISDKKAVS